MRALRGKLGLAAGTPLGSVYDSVITTKKVHGGAQFWRNYGAITAQLRRNSGAIL